MGFRPIGHWYVFNDRRIIMIIFDPSSLAWYVTLVSLLPDPSPPSAKPYFLRSLTFHPAPQKYICTLHRNNGIIRRCKILYLIVSIRYFHNGFVVGNLSETPPHGTFRARLRPPAHSYPKPTAAKPSLWVHHDAFKLQVTILFSPHVVHFHHCCNHCIQIAVHLDLSFFSNQRVITPNVLGFSILLSNFPL